MSEIQQQLERLRVQIDAMRALAHEAALKMEDLRATIASLPEPAKERPAKPDESIIP